MEFGFRNFMSLFRNTMSSNEKKNSSHTNTIKMISSIVVSKYLCLGSRKQEANTGGTFKGVNETDQESLD